MNTRDEKAPSLRRRLFALLLLPAVAILVAGTLSDYFTAVTPFHDAYDQALIDAALAVAGHIHPDAQGRPRLSLPPDAISVLRADSIDSIYFRVSTSDGAYIAGDRDLPELHRSIDNPTRGSAHYRGDPIRLVSYRTYGRAGMVTISVGETLHKREQIRGRILSSALAVDVGELGMVLAVIWLGVRFALEPLRNVQEQIARRPARDLSPLPLQTVPLEARSVVEALNRLFKTVRDGSNAQRRFLESAAHQLRTPLAGIQAQLELMAADEPDGSRQERLRLLLDAARRLTHTTQQLLALARSDEAANLSWELMDVDLIQIVESAVADRIAAADLAEIDLGAQIQPAMVRGVGWLLAEALGNLANNAIAHTPPGGSVTLRCGVLEGAPFLGVVDTGVGIPAEERTRVLDRFFRGSNALGTGSGLGLAIVKEVAQLHGAALSIAAGPEGKGTSIMMTFPGTRVTPATSLAKSP